MGFLPIALGWERERGGEERGGSGVVRGKGEREEQKNTHSDNDERTKGSTSELRLVLMTTTGSILRRWGTTQELKGLHFMRSRAEGAAEIIGDILVKAPVACNPNPPYPNRYVLPPFRETDLQPQHDL